MEVGVAKLLEKWYALVDEAPSRVESEDEFKYLLRGLDFPHVVAGP